MTSHISVFNADMATACGRKCKEEIKTDDEVVKCACCEVKFHRKCTDVSKTIHLELIKRDTTILYRCVKCLVSGNLEKWRLTNLTDVNESMKKLEATCTAMNEKIDRMEENVHDVLRTTVLTLDDFSNRAAPAPEVVKINPLYADVLKKSHVLVVKPKDSTKNREEIKSSLKEAIDPAKFGVRNLRNATKEGVIIEVGDDQECDELKVEAEKKLGDQFTFEKPKKMLPRIKMLRVYEPEYDAAFITELTRRNPFMELDAGSIKIIKREEVKFKRSPYQIFNMVLEVNQRIFEAVMEQGWLFMGWKTCRVVDGANVKRCFNCYGFNHVSENCKNKRVCMLCGGDDHLRKECKSNEMKCTNCMEANKRLNMNLDAQHSVWSRECEAYKHKLENLKRKIG